MSTELHSGWILAPTVASLGHAPRVAIDVLRAEGWQGVQLDARMEGTRPQDLGTSARRDLLVHLRRGNQMLNGLDLWIPDSAYRDPSSVQRAVDVTMKTIDLAADLNRCVLSLVLPQPEEDDDPLHEVGTVLRARALQQGVRLADHCLGSQGNDEEHGIGIDPVAILSTGGDPAIVLSSVASRVAAIRLSDLTMTGERVPPLQSGTGRLDLLAYKVALSLIPWTDGIVVDLRQWPDPMGGLQEVRLAWDAVDGGTLS